MNTMETRVDICEASSSVGFFMEAHEIRTEDGYILTLLRVRPEKGLKSTRSEDVQITIEGEETPKPAVLICHGFLCSSEEWLINSPDKVLPYRLANEGYDCWLANLRGTSLSMGHVDIPKGSKKFWDFSFHEMGIYDIPAMINYILDTTGNKNLNYIGHSMGCALLAICLSLKPEYCSKVKLMVALAPAIYLQHIRIILFRMVAFFTKFVGKSRYIRTRPIIKNTTRYYMDKVCFSDPSKSKGRAEKLGNWCLKHPGVWLGAFGNAGQIDDIRLAEIAKKWPGTTSLKLFCHGIQVHITGEVKQYDFGASKNMKLYGQRIPPFYDFANVNIPVLAFCSDGDKLCPPKAVRRFVSKMPNVVGLHTIETPSFAHVDFLMGKDANKLVYDKVIDAINNFPQTTEKK